ncbi:MAG: hypothetical protein RL757_2568 [Bacteroidota bacterium]|jgi:NAD-dependent deacetylase
MSDISKPIVVVLTGAGISAESGISTFRDADGLWENHRIEDVASPEGWAKNPILVLDFYNKRRQQLFDVLPNAAHVALKDLEEKYDVRIVTQNVDDLHERAGSATILHLHGKLREVRSTRNPKLVQYWEKDVNWGDTCPLGSQLRPNIVWFGEEVPLLYDAAEWVSSADYILIIGTSMQVYPAAGLVGYARKDAPIFYIDPFPKASHELKIATNKEILAEAATIGVPKIVEKLLNIQKNIK